MYDVVNAAQEVALVVVTAPVAADRPWLAGRTAGEQSDRTAPGQWDLKHVAADDSVLIPGLVRSENLNRWGPVINESQVR
jgi:hypothetical protein